MAHEPWRRGDAGREVRLVRRRRGRRLAPPPGPGVLRAAAGRAAPLEGPAAGPLRRQPRGLPGAPRLGPGPAPGGAVRGLEPGPGRGVPPHHRRLPLRLPRPEVRLPVAGAGDAPAAGGLAGLAAWGRLRRGAARGRAQRRRQARQGGEGRGPRRDLQHRLRLPAGAPLRRGRGVLTGWGRGGARGRPPRVGRFPLFEPPPRALWLAPAPWPRGPPNAAPCGCSVHREGDGRLGGRRRRRGVGFGRAAHWQRR
mmetsp:Transcript_8623/g.18925  ORF Transcript_8623/g.18925 Transcript_8623/m.18925 type:complete len:253 (+) Transcript_8623:829-1587(+)